MTKVAAVAVLWKRWQWVAGDGVVVALIVKGGGRKGVEGAQVVVW